MGAERERPTALLIAGPTASGKSALALRLAERLGGTLINADSMQVYHDLRILTARPTAADEARVPHALFGTVDGACAHSVSAWLADAGQALAAARAAGAIPIFIGGTGLYLKALTQGLSDIPAVPEAVRQTVRTWAAGRQPRELHAALAARDPGTAARLRPTDPQRITRALEVFEATGRSLASFQERRTPPLLDVRQCAAIYLTPQRDLLRRRLDDRLERMLAEGALEEVGRLGARGLDRSLPVMRALGVPPLLAHLDGRLGLGDAVDLVKMETRRYAKRQETFARTQLLGFVPATPDEAEAAVLAAFEGQFV